MSRQETNACILAIKTNLFFVVKIIISLSSYNINSSPRSVFLKLSDKRLFESEYGVEGCRLIVLINESSFGKLLTALKGKDRIAECRIELEASSDVAALILI